jgi:hypothetical protein
LKVLTHKIPPHLGCELMKATMRLMHIPLVVFFWQFIPVLFPMKRMLVENWWREIKTQRYCQPEVRHDSSTIYHHIVGYPFMQEDKLVVEKQASVCFWTRNGSQSAYNLVLWRKSRPFVLSAFPCNGINWLWETMCFWMWMGVRVFRT